MVNDFSPMLSRVVSSLLQPLNYSSDTRIPKSDSLWNTCAFLINGTPQVSTIDSHWRAVLLSRDQSPSLFSFACFPKENIPRRYQSFTELSFVFATTTQKSINKYPAKGLAPQVGLEPTAPRLTAACSTD